VELARDANMMASIGEQLFDNEGQFTAIYSTRSREYIAARKAFTDAARRDLERW
jgi:ferredoxin-NADP reductase